jgi:hypothetical protein
MAVRERNRGSCAEMPRFGRVGDAIPGGRAAGQTPSRSAATSLAVRGVPPVRGAGSRDDPFFGCWTAGAAGSREREQNLRAFESLQKRPIISGFGGTCRVLMPAAPGQKIGQRYAEEPRAGRACGESPEAFGAHLAFTARFIRGRAGGPAPFGANPENDPISGLWTASAAARKREQNHRAIGSCEGWAITARFRGICRFLRHPWMLVELTNPLTFW